MTQIVGRSQTAWMTPNPAVKGWYEEVQDGNTKTDPAAMPTATQGAVIMRGHHC